MLWRLALPAVSRYRVGMSRVVDWDGKNVPEEMRSLPPGRYVVEPVDQAIALTPEEDAGLEEAILAMDAGDSGVTIDEVRESLRLALKR